MKGANMAMNICANMFKRPKSNYNMRGKTDSELLQIITNTTPGTDQHEDAVVDLEWRRWWRNFWLKGIVAWIALGVGAASLIWNIVNSTICY